MSFSTENKVNIRRYWGKPLLKFVYKQLNTKLLYLGLPSPEIEDLIEWLDYVVEVIAFQCDDHRYPNAFETLRANLHKLELQDKINTFQAFNGYIEEVILQGYDNSGEPQLFDLNEYVTVYNLDFCNQIDSPLEILDRDGNVKNVYKFDAVKKLLELQDSLSEVSSKFILFLTVHCSYNGGELKDYLDTCDHQSYLMETRKNLKSHELNARIVRLFVIETLSNYFRTFGFIPQIFPTIFYNGINATPLLHFTVIGTKNQSAGLTPWYQSTSQLIKEKFVKVGVTEFENMVSPGVAEDDNPVLNPVDFFVKTNSFTKYWKSKETAK